MTNSRTWLRYASDEWHRGDALEAGETLYERVAVRDRPAWAARVLDACSAAIAEVPPEARQVRELAFAAARWSEAHDAFYVVRQRVLAVLAAGEESEPTLELGVLHLAENVAKVTYNASGSQAPFDAAAGARIAQNARWIVERSTRPGLDARVWAALAGQPDLTDETRLENRDLRPLWIDDYHDGPLSGAVLLGGKLRWFAICSEVDRRRRYAVYELTDAEIADEQRWHDLFVEHVGAHWTYGEDGEARAGAAKPLSEHAKFYDPYSEREPVDYSRNPLLGWFEL